MGAYTVTMRVYVPAVLSELSVLLPPVRGGVIAVPDAAMSGEDVEVLEDDAITEAALSSLELARETDGALPARVVLAVDTPTSTTLTPGDEVEAHIFTAPLLRVHVVGRGRDPRGLARRSLGGQRRPGG